MQNHNLLLIGSSTGGPKIIGDIFRGLPRLNCSVVIIQHTPTRFDSFFAEHLNTLTEMRVQLASNNVTLESGSAYIAQGGRHMRLLHNRKIEIFMGERVNYVIPSIDVTMLSVEANHGGKLMGILLTGMGKDGAKGIAHIKDLGGTTIAQDEKTSVIFSMPKAAISTGKVDEVMPHYKMAQKLIDTFGTL